MKTFPITVKCKTMLADTITPVSIYLKIRDLYPNAVLLESSDYHGSENSYSFIGLQPIAGFIVDDGIIIENYPGEAAQKSTVEDKDMVTSHLQQFIKSFQVNAPDEKIKVNGMFGYSSYDAVQYFENIRLESSNQEQSKIPEIRYHIYRFIIAINHFKNELFIVENLMENELSKLHEVQDLLLNKNIATYPFSTTGNEVSNLTDQEYMDMVTKGKEHCQRGDVFQIVLSRQFSQQFTGDEFNVYRALRSVNPSPYLFYFDYGNYKIFGSSPEAQIIVKDNTAVINPIAGTFKRTGNDKRDRELAHELVCDPKENAEHVMLVDLARNDLSRNSKDVKVETYREVQYFSHVLHLVSKVTGELHEDTNIIKVMGDCFPAGTLSGAPKHKAMQLIDKYENQKRGFYGGSIGYVGFDGELNQAILIRSFLSKNNRLFCQAGAGIVAASKENNELNEVTNKLLALKTAINMAANI